METPLYKLSERDLDTVYSPSEDSFLLMDALESDLDVLKARKPVMCLEIGSGSGIVITALAVTFRKVSHQVYCLAIDINPDACRVTKETMALNSVDIEIVQMDLLTSMRSVSAFDLVLFNPPYVMTEDEEMSDKNNLSKAWAGGTNGRKVMDRIFDKIPEILSTDGTFYLVVIKENDPEYILKRFKKLNMTGEIMAERKIRGEHLYILRFRKAS